MYFYFTTGIQEQEKAFFTPREKKTFGPPCCKNRFSGNLLNESEKSCLLHEKIVVTQKLGKKYKYLEF